MKVIVEHDAHAEPYLRQYAKHIASVGEICKIIELDPKHLSWLKELTHAVELDFDIHLCSQQLVEHRAFLINAPIILATIGKEKHKQADCFYHMTHYILTDNSATYKNDEALWVSCFNDTSKIFASDYIKCIACLKELALRYQKSLLIYASVSIPDLCFRYRSLTSKLISQHLADINGCLIVKGMEKDISKYYAPGEGSYEFYQDRVIYLEDDLEAAVKKALPHLKGSRDSKRFKKIYQECRQTQLLYDDVFYASIPADENIYVILSIGNFRESEFYEALGLEPVRILGDYSVLYGAKGQFDALSHILRPDVIPSHRLPILSYPRCLKVATVAERPYRLMAEEPRHKGQGVYIGIVGTDWVDYTSQVLRRPDGSTRIASIWEQVRAGEGNEYFSEQINAALASPNPEAVIPLPEEDSISTMMLAISGGLSTATDYQGVATEAEFVVAKVTNVSENLQRIFGGTSDRHAAIMPDILIGVIQLISFAVQQNRPIVICVPFNSNIDAHDGSLITQNILGELARIQGVTLIVPTGEEADKMHHYSVEGRQNALGPINLRVVAPNQNVAGVIYQRYPTLLTGLLYPPQGITGDAVNLKQAGITRLRDSVIYSQGEEVDFLNGSRRIFFRIDNPAVGTWRIEGTLRADIMSDISLWLSQQELNPFASLSPSNPLITAGSTANVEHMISVGGYDKDNIIVLRSSGRGFSWDNRVVPSFVTHSHQIITPCGRGEWASVTGTLPAAAIIAGAAASLYSKLLAEGVSPLPNTLVMNSSFLGALRQFEDVTYPNPSQGYGVFDIESLHMLLGIPYIL